MERCRVYTAEEFLKELLDIHKKEMKEYENLKESFDFGQITKVNNALKDLIGKKTSICFMIDVLSFQPTFRANKLLQKNFMEYILAADAIQELIYEQE